VSTLDTAALFSRLELPGLSLPNRIVMSPMTREFAPGGVLVGEAADYYARRAAGGAGLLITEGTSVDHPVSHHTSRVPHLYGPQALAAWQGVVDRVHAAGGRIVPQLWHTGLYRLRDETANPEALNIAPSEVGAFPAAPMTETDIAEVIDAFARSALAAREVGFDGIALHGGHGYLIDQFLWPRTNRRSDRYGGPVENRVRFGVEVVRAVRRAVGPDCSIFFRFSQWKGTRYGQELAASPDELEALLGPLAEAGVDVFDASMRRFWLPEFDGSPLNLAGWAKKVTGKAAMAVGSVGLEGPLDGIRVSEQSATAVSRDNLSALAAMMERGDFDLVGVGRALLANPDWPRLVAQGEFDRLRGYDPARTKDFLEPSL
jgi:2,4-dienoyl-CoA reductase-like NADH-dependent reductase (Old Yellow Enzyme family)